MREGKSVREKTGRKREGKRGEGMGFCEKM
jgi:hypothetical protein